MTTVNDLATIFKAAPSVAAWLLKKNPGNISAYAAMIRHRGGCHLYCVSAGPACLNCEDRPKQEG